MPTADAYKWLGPKLASLVADAEKAGIARDVSVAVITDIINGPSFNAGPIETNENWNRDPGEPDAAVNQSIGISLESAEPAPYIDNVPPFIVPRY